MLDYVDKYEAMAETKLRKDFAEGLGIFEEALNILAEYINAKRLGHPNFAMDFVTKDYRELEPEAVCFFACAILLSEALNRLLACRRLFINGYISRALACGRDAIECAMVADICKNDLEQTKAWARGKQIKITKKYNYHRALNWNLWRLAQEIMSPSGTHAYMQAAFLSSTLQQAILLNNDKEIQKMYMHDAGFVLRRLLIKCAQLMQYIKSCYRDSITDTNRFNQVMKNITNLVEREEAQISLDELLVEKGLWKPPTF
jgi:hypothetical protein